jgi:hypothetical protein
LTADGPYSEKAMKIPSYVSPTPTYYPGLSYEYGIDVIIAKLEISKAFVTRRFT